VDAVLAFLLARTSLVIPAQAGIQLFAVCSSFRRKPDCDGRMPKRTFAQRMARRARRGRGEQSSDFAPASLLLCSSFRRKLESSSRVLPFASSAGHLALSKFCLFRRPAPAQAPEWERHATREAALRGRARETNVRAPVTVASARDDNALAHATQPS